MTSDANLILQEFDPKKKTYGWAGQCVTSLRINWRQLKNVIQCRDNRAIMYSMQTLTKVRDSFDDEDFKKSTDWLPVPVLEPLLNSIVEDLTKQPPRCELRAVDPTALTEKKEDLELLKYRGILERDRTELQKRVFPEAGQYKVPYEKFNGNVEEFDKMGLDERDPDDVNFYEQNYQRLWYEIGGQSLINNVLKTNQFDKTTIRKLVKDIFWAKAICVQSFVDQTTGEIKYKYKDPTTCFGIFGESNDGKDDICRGWQDSITVMEFMEMLGNEFDFINCWKELLWAINFCNNQKFTGFIRGGISYDCCGDGAFMDKMGFSSQSALLDWSMAYKYNVYCGYVEWRTWEATSTKITKKDNPDYLEYVDYQYQLTKKKAKEGYEKTSKLQQQWYCTYFLANSSISQYCYKFQKVYFQKITGVNDEYSNGTLCYYQEEGKSAVEIAKVYLQLVNFCYYRMMWIIYKAKPDADEFIWEELTQLAQTVKREFPQAGTNAIAPKIETVIQDLIKQMRAKHVRIRTYPRVDGKPQPIQPIEKAGSGGLDPIAIAMQAILSWAEGQIASKIGINPMRIGANPPSRESTASENRTLEASYSTTGYFYRMIEYLKNHLAVSTLNYATDILQYKDSLPYNWIKTILGNESFQALNALGKFSAHRYGIFIEDYNYNFEKERFLQACDIALSQKTLTMPQWGILTMQAENPKLGFKILAHLELKAKKKERAQALQDQQIADNLNKNAHTREMERLQFDRGTKFGVADREGKALIESAKIQAGSRVEVKKIQVDAEPPKQQAKADADKQVIQAESEAKNQEAFAI